MSPDGYTPVEVVEVRAWGRRVGAVAPDPAAGAYVCEYAPEWIAGAVELAPLHMPNRPGPYVFPDLDARTWNRLPPLLADALPDDFGNTLVDAWMAGRGIDRDRITPLDRLAYTGERGMGALTFHPPLADPPDEPTAIALADLVTSARQVLAGEFPDAAPAEEALRQLIQVGSSAGGARAKAVVAFNPETAQIRSGQFDPPPGFGQWLVKLDGVTAGQDRGVRIVDGAGYGRIEYAYHRMATAAGITMTECRLLPEGPRAHFLTRRFDRTDDGGRLHVLSLCGMDHLDFRRPGAHSYEQLLMVVESLGLGPDAAAEVFRRCVFNVAAVNRDDHTRNVAFCCTPDGEWSLAPAFDLTHSYRVDSVWVAHHQMSVNGRTEGIERDDLEEMGDRFAVPGYRGIIDEVLAAVAAWEVFADDAGVPDDRVTAIRSDMAAFAPR